MPAAELSDTEAPATSASVTTLLELRAFLKAPEEETVPTGVDNATPSSSTIRPENDGLVFERLLIEMSSPSALVRMMRRLSGDVTAETPVSAATLLIAKARLVRFVGVTSADISIGKRFAASRSNVTTPLL